MKVAVLLFGQPRDAIACSSYITKNIISPNNADVFIHAWYDSNDLYMEKGEKGRSNCFLDNNLDQHLLDIYKPKASCIEPQKFIHFDNRDNYYDCPVKYVKNMCKCGKNKELTYDEVKLRMIKYTHISQLYSAFKANLLKEEYSLENNITYDYVIKLRYDAVCECPIFLDPLSKPINALLFPNIGQKDNLVCDWFQIGNSQIMNIVCSIFLHLKYLNATQGFYKQGDRLPITLWETDQCSMSVEILTRDILHLHKIPWIACDFNIKLSANS